MSALAKVIPGLVGAGLRAVVPGRLRPIGYLTHLTMKRTGRQVRAGPFRGMNYVEQSVGSCLVPKLLGIYERELTYEIERICRWRPKLIVDIGAAEGYYAVGMALRNPEARVVAFEMDRRGREVLREVATRNNVTGRLSILGECEPDSLRAILRNGPKAVCVICDVEGDEERLLDPTVVPELIGVTLLVETHEFVQRGITNELRRRFAASHRIDLIWQEPRTRADFPWRTLGTMLLPGSYLDWAVSEWRPERMSWLWMTPKSMDE